MFCGIFNTAFGIGLADTELFGYYVILNHRITMGHHLPSCSISDHFLHSISQDHRPIHVFLPVLTLFPLPQCTFSTQIRSMSLRWWTHPLPFQQNLLLSLCISTQASVMVLYIYHPSCLMSVSLPLLTAPQGRVGLQSSWWQFSGIVGMEGGSCYARNTKLPSVLLFMLLFLESLVFLNKSPPLSLFPCHWGYFEHKSAGSSCL